MVRQDVTEQRARSARALSFQSTYRCQRSGACCTSSWPIPVEPDRLARIQVAVASGALRARATSSGSWVQQPPALGPVLAIDRGRCVFFQTTDRRDCAIHAVLGHDALPHACRQFPRVSVHDPRGTSVVLSCYCPTAAALLDAPGAVTIVESPAAFPHDGEYVGLDTRRGWPPILRPGVLMDWPSWWTFEARAVNLIANVAASPDDAMSRLSAVVARVRTWLPGGVPLESAIVAAFDECEHPAVDAVPLNPAACRGRVAALHASIPREWNVRPEPAQPIREPPTRQRRFLTCHAFANWAVHLGDDLRAWLNAVASAHALMTSGFGVREADLWLRHLVPVPGLRGAPTAPTSGSTSLES
jgi:Fe-S-cluster containining protein